MFSIVIAIKLLCIIELTFGQEVDYLTVQPSYLKSCEIKKPGFSNCSTADIQSLFKQFKHGVPGLKTFGSVDPFHINKVKFNQDNNNVANIAATMTDVDIYGAGDTIVKESKVSKKDFSWHTKFLIPKIRLEGQYQLEGQVLIIPLKGNGKVLIEVDNLDMDVYTKTRLYEKGNFTFYNVTKVRINLEIGGLKSEFENLFNGNKEIEESTKAFFNENWKELFEAIRPIITKTLQDILLSTYKQVFAYIPANFFVSDIPTSKELYKKRNK